MVLLTIVFEGEDTPLPRQGEAQGGDPVDYSRLGKGDAWQEKEAHVHCHGYLKITAATQLSRNFIRTHNRLVFTKRTFPSNQQFDLGIYKINTQSGVPLYILLEIPIFT